MNRILAFLFNRSSNAIPAQQGIPERVNMNCLSETIHSIVSKSKNGVINIPPGIAQRILDEANFAGQRKVKEYRVQERLEDITHQRWRPQVAPISFAQLPDGKLCLVNGQHRLHAIARSGTNVPNLVTIIPADNDADVRRLYALFDTPESRRSDTEMLQGAGVHEALGLKTRTTAALFKAMTLLRSDLEPTSNSMGVDAKSRNGRLEDINDWATEARLFESLIEGCDSFLSRKMSTQSAMASFLYLLRHGGKLAVEFVSGIAENDGLKKGDPRARLIADFSNRSLRAGSIRQGVQQVSVAWNAFYDGRDLSIIKCHDGAPIIFKGTPKGKAR